MVGEGRLDLLSCQRDPTPGEKSRSNSGSWLTASPSQTGPSTSPGGPPKQRQALDSRDPPLWDLHPKLSFWGTLFPTPSAAVAAEESWTPVSKEAETPTAGPILVTTGHMTMTQSHVLAACRPTRGLSQAPPLSGPQFPQAKDLLVSKALSSLPLPRGGPDPPKATQPIPWLCCRPSALLRIPPRTKTDPQRWHLGTCQSQLSSRGFLLCRCTRQGLHPDSQLGLGSTGTEALRPCVRSRAAPSS